METAWKPSGIATHLGDATRTTIKNTQCFVALLGTERAKAHRMNDETTTYPALQVDGAVLWKGHEGVYLLLERTSYSGLLREWGNADSKLLWTMLEELTPITKDEAVAKMMNDKGSL
jgi:hypothetical protein